MLLEDRLEVGEVVIYRDVVFPPQQQNGDIGVGHALRLALDEHGGILEMAGEGLEVMAFGDGDILQRMLLLLVLL
jgi:hypothetical protein